MAEHRAVWKSDNQGIEEVTFMQMGKRGGDAGNQRCATGWSRTHVWWVNIRRVIPGVKHSSSIPDHPDQGSSGRKISPHNFWL